MDHDRLVDHLIADASVLSSPIEKIIKRTSACKALPSGELAISRLPRSTGFIRAPLYSIRSGHDMGRG